MVNPVLQKRADFWFALFLCKEKAEIWRLDGVTDYISNPGVFAY